MTKKNFWRSAAPSLLSIVFGLLLGLLVIFVTKPDQAGVALPNFLRGPFNTGWIGFGNLFYYATPLLMTGLSVGFAYKTGLFNIGAAGQYLFGAFLSILIAYKCKGIIPDAILWLVALLAAGFGGALLGAIVGALKAYRNVNEVITCIMLNYTVMYIVNDLIKSWGIYNQLKNSTVGISASIPKMGLDLIFPKSIIGGGILIAILLVFVLHVLLRKTTFGFELRGVGLNRHAAQYAGINENRSIVLSMAISGALAGLGGAMVMLAGSGAYLAVRDVLPQEGFDGLAIALLGLSEPVGIFLAALFVAALKMGGQAIQTLGYTPELTTIIIAMILYISALSVLFKRLFARGGKKEKKFAPPRNSAQVADVQEAQGTEMLSDEQADQGVEMPVEAMPDTASHAQCNAEDTPVIVEKERTKEGGASKDEDALRMEAEASSEHSAIRSQNKTVVRHHSPEYPSVGSNEEEA